jgi:hypothetical protein
MQLLAYRWKNFYLINSDNKNQQRQIMFEELTKVLASEFMKFSLGFRSGVGLFGRCLRNSSSSPHASLWRL